MPTPGETKKKCFRRKRPHDEDAAAESGDEEEHRSALEEVKFLQKKRERRWGIPALPGVEPPGSGGGGGVADPNGGGLKKAGVAGGGGGGGDGEKDDLVLQDTFAQETAVTVEDPNMLKYVEQELAKQRGRSVGGGDKGDQVESELKRLEDELYAVPEHLKVKRRNPEESSTQWTTGIAEVQLPIEYKLRNIEETEAAKKLLQEKRLAGKAKSELNIPASYSADYIHRGRDYAEKLRREHPELYKDRGDHGERVGAKNGNTGAADVIGRRQAATDEIMLERFRKRERHRVMRR